MSRPIDEKIVAMKMDNSDLKRKAVETTSIFGKLTNALNKIPGVNLGKTSKDLGNIGKNAKDIKMDQLATSIERVSSRFSTLGVIGTTALVNITNRAVNAGLAIYQSLTSAPIMDGFREYEQKIGAIGTMLANTEWAGSSLDDVKGVLEELNVYADRTIYNFAEMTSSIGRFTAAGVRLEDSAIAIKGIGNLAAISGSNSQQMNTAMYQMSQMLAAGKMNLMDWNSLVNAGMGGKKTQDGMLATAKAMGVAVDMSEGFRNSLSDGWLTAEVFLETMKRFGQDEAMTEAATKVRTFTQLMDTLKEGVGSSWATTWELIFGDFEEATRFWTAISDLVGGILEKSGESRNRMLQAFIDGKGLSGLVYVMSGFRNTLQPVVQLLGAVGNAFKQAFPPSGINTIHDVTKMFHELTKGMRFSENTVANITTIFRGVFSIFSSVWEITKALTQAVFGLLPSFRDVGVGALSFLAAIAAIPIKLNEAIKTGGVFKVLMDSLGIALGVISIGITALGKSLDWIGNKFRPIKGVIGSAFGGGHISQANDELRTMKDILSPITNFFKRTFEAIVSGFNWVKDKLVGFGQMIKNAFPSGNTLVAGGFIAALIAVTTNALIVGWKLFEVFTGWGEIGAGIADSLEGVGRALNAFALSVAAGALIKVAVAIAILAGSLMMISSLDTRDIVEGMYALVGALSGLIGGLAIINKYNIAGQISSVTTLIGLSIAVMLVAVALRKLIELDPATITKGLYGLTGMMAALAGALTLISRFGGGAIGASALQIVAIAGAMHIMVSAINKIAEVDANDMYKGVTALGFIMILMAGFLKATSGTKFGIGSTLGMLAISSAINNIVKSIVKIATIDTKILIEGLTTITLILAAIAGFAIATSSMGLLSAGAGMLIMAVALRLLLTPIQKLGSMPFDIMVKGLFGMTTALLGIAAASIFMQGTIGGAIGIGIMAGALILLLAPITAFASMQWGSIFKGIIGLTGTLVGLSLAAVLLSPAIPLILGFGVALGLMGIAMLAAGGGMALFGTGLLTLSTLSVGAITTIIASIGTLLAGLISLAPLAANFIGDVVYKVIEAITNYAPKISDKIAEFLISMINVIARRGPEFIAAGTDLIVNFIYGIAEARERLINAAVDSIIMFIEGMANTIETEGPRMTRAMMKLWGAILLTVVDAGVAMIDALFGWIPGVKKATAEIGATAEKHIRDNFMADEIGLDKGTDFATGLSNTEKLASVSGLTIAEAAQSAMGSVDTTNDGSNFGQGFINGIKSTLSNVVTAASNLATGAALAIKERLVIRSPSHVTREFGEHAGQGLANGINAKAGVVNKAAGSLAGILMDWLGVDGYTPLKIEKGGVDTANSFAKGINAGKPKATKAASGVGKSVAKTMNDKFREEMDKAEKKFKMGTINSDQHIKEIEKIKNAYAKYPELVWEANQKIKQIEKDAARDSFNNSKAWIDEKKYYNKLSLEEELAAWIRVKRRYDQGTEERKQADREIYRLKQELNKKEFNNSKDWIDERKYYNELSLTEELNTWQRIMNKYEKGTEERKQAEREVYRLKNDINSKLISLNDDYINKVSEANRRLIEGERELNAEYTRSVDERTKALTGFAGIFDAVKEASDVSGIDLINNLRSQVVEFSKWGINIQTLASKGIDDGLLEELRQMGPKASAEIAALNNLTAEQLSEYSSLWKAKNLLAREQATKELEGLKKDTANKIGELRNETANQLEGYRKEWVKKVAEIRNGTTKEFVGLNATMKDIGLDSIKGLMKGMGDMEGPLKAQAQKIADSISTTIKNALKIQSPSRVLEGLGNFATIGLANGMTSKIGLVSDSAKQLAITAIDSLNGLLEGFELPIEDSELHFKAVVDYENLDLKKFGKIKPVSIVPDTSFTTGLVTAIKSKVRQNDNKTPRGNEDKTNNDQRMGDVSNRPIVIQSILNGRIIAEETFNDTNQLFNNLTNLEYSMKGV